MGNLLDGFVDLMIIVAVFFFLPLLWTSSQSEKLLLAEASSRAAAFIDEVTGEGYVSEEAYSRFMEGLSATGSMFDVTLSYEQTVYDPYEQMEYSVAVYDEEILDALEARGAFLMTRGASITVSLKYSQRSLPGRILYAFIGRGAMVSSAQTGIVNGMDAAGYMKYFIEP